MALNPAYLRGATPGALQEQVKRALAVGLLAALGLVPSFTRAAEIEGVRFAERAAGEAPLELRSTALFRYRYWFKVYVAALYLAPGIDLQRVLEDVPKRLEIEYFYGFSAEDFAQSTLRKISDNFDPEVVELLKPRIEALNRLFRPVEPGDRYALTYIPERGLELSLNGETLGVVEGPDLAVAMFSIWLGDRPLDRSVKEQLLKGVDPAPALPRAS
jgi:hypothetical protein